MARVETSEKTLLNQGVLLEDYLGVSLQNEESTLVVISGAVYKIIDGKLRKKKQRVVEYLYEMNHGLPIDLQDVLYENGHFMGYVMDLYDDYQALYDLMNQDLSLDEKKQIAKRLIEVGERFSSLGIVYSDWHSKNVIYRDELKLLDIDSGRITSNCEHDWKARKDLFLLCLGFIVGFDLDYDLTLNGEERDDILHLLGYTDLLTRESQLSWDSMIAKMNAFTMNKVEESKGLILKRYG